MLCYCFWQVILLFIRGYARGSGVPVGGAGNKMVTHERSSVVVNVAVAVAQVNDEGSLADILASAAADPDHTVASLDFAPVHAAVLQQVGLIEVTVAAAQLGILGDAVDVVEEFREGSERYEISAVIYVMRDTQKGIIIGKGGQALKKVGTQARLDMEDFFQKKVFLRLFVKVDPDWRENKKELRKFGYEY